MIVLTICVLFLPPLLLAEGNIEIGPFHRSQPAWSPRNSSTISSNLPANQQVLKSSPPELPRHDQETSQVVHVITPTEKSDSVDPTTFQPEIVTDSPVEIQSHKPTLAHQSQHPVSTDNRHQDISAYQTPKPASKPWTSPEPPTLPSIGLRRASSPVHVHSTSYVYQSPPPVTPVSTEKSVLEPSTLPPIISKDLPEEIQTQKPSQPNAPHLTYADNGHKDTSTYHVPKPALNSWIPPRFNRIPLLDLERESQPNTGLAGYVASYLYQPYLPVIPVSAENSLLQNVPVVPNSDRKKLTDTLVKIQTPKPSLSDPLLPVYAGNRRLDSYYVPRPAPIPWIPRELSTNLSKDMSADMRALAWPQPIYVDQRRHIGAGPYHRPQRSAASWDEQLWDSFVEDRISHLSLRHFMCPQAHGYFKHTDKCHEYIECKNYVPLAYTCPVGFHFNPQVEWTEYPCDHPSNVQCNEETTLPTTATPPAPTASPTKVVTTPRPNNQKPDGFMCHQPHGYFKFNDQCGEYIECKNYVPLIFTCPAGLQFNPRVEWTEYPCEHPSIVQCEMDEKTPKSTTAPPPPPTTRPPPPPTTRRPAPPPTTRRPPPPPTTRRPTPPPTTRRPPPPPTTRRPPPPPTTRRPPPPPTTRQPPPPPPTTGRPPRPTTRPPPPPTTRLPPPPPTTRRPPPPPTSTSLPVITTSPKNPPDYNVCLQQYGYIKFSDHCGEYIECKNYVPLKLTCPVGLHFNHLAEWTEYPCDHPSKVQCNGEPLHPTDPPTTQPPPAPTTPSPVVTTPHPGSKVYDFKCPQAHGYFKHNDQCSEYIECKNHVPLTYACPGGLHFNVFVDWTEYPCDHPSNVQCNKEPGTKQPTENPNVTSIQPPTAVTPNMPRFPTQGTVGPPTEHPSYEPIDFYCQKPNAYYSVASQCDTYIECKDSKAIKNFCLAGLHFDSKVQWPDYPCNYPSRVQCNNGPVIDVSNIPVTRPNFGTPRPTVGTPQPTVGTPRPTVVTQPNTAVTPNTPRFPIQETVRPPTKGPSHEPIDFHCQEPNAYYSVTSQCDTYIECKNNRAIQHSCPAGLHFNPKAQWPKFPCNYPSRVQCNNGSVIDHSNIPVTRPDIGVERPNFGKQRPTIGTPRPTVGTPRPTVGTPRPTVGTPRPTVGTPRPTVGTPRPTVGTPRPSIVAQQPKSPSTTANCPQRDGFFPTDSDDCGEYMVCHAGIAIIEHCPAGLVFNFEKDTCDWPVNVPECNHARALDGFVCPVRSVDEDELTIHKYRYERSCKSFVACQQGHPRLLSCDAGLHFNEEIESCVDSTLVVDCDA